MAKIKKTDISKLSKIDQQIEELKKQKKQQQEQLSKKIGDYFLSKIDIENINNSDVIYELIDKISEEYNNNDNDEQSENNETSAFKNEDNSNLNDN
ncbi:hypothetical protein [Staphylococcus hominis]|uniref:hypothetical protein n=1 Tax=Staphylococcus hominis TaxID=1290 RepID=UPI0011AADE15|nr:hypothetical protein [Staphylococcus hominis]